MLLEAAAKLDIDLEASYMIGDTLEDLRAGTRAGCRPVLVRTGYGEQAWSGHSAEAPAGTRVAADLPEAIAGILATRAGEA